MDNTKKITLEEIDPVEIYGAKNLILDTLCKHFPDLKVAARGAEITLIGKDGDITGFEAALKHLIEKRLIKRSLTPYDAEEFFESEENEGRNETLAADSVIVYGNDGRPVKARTKNQMKMVKDYYSNDLIFALGPAGTGKTYVAIALAVRALKNREIRRIVLTRPAVEAGEKLGFLPGDLREKLNPYLLPLYDALKDIIPYAGIAIAVMTFTYWATLNLKNIYLLMIAKIFIAASLYTGITWLSGSATFKECVGYLRKKK